WTTAANWSGGVVPGSTDNVIISGATVTVDNNVVAHDLTVSSSTTITDLSNYSINVAGSCTLSNSTIGAYLSLNGSCSVSGCTIDNSAVVEVTSGQTLTISSATTLDNSSLDNFSIIVWTGGDITLINGGNIDNAGTFDVQCDASILDGGSGTNSIT